MSARSITLVSGDAVYELRVTGPDRDGTVHVSGLCRRGDETAFRLPEFRGRASLRNGEVELAVAGGPLRCAVAWERRGVWVACRGRAAFFEPAGGGARRPAAAPSRDEVRAPMTGVLVEVRVAPGARVAAGEVLAVMEAMKMEYRLAAPRNGQVEQVAVRPGDRVELGAVVVRLAGAADVEQEERESAAVP